MSTPIGRKTPATYSNDGTCPAPNQKPKAAPAPKFPTSSDGTCPAPNRPPVYVPQPGDEPSGCNGGKPRWKFWQK